MTRHTKANLKGEGLFSTAKDKLTYLFFGFQAISRNKRRSVSMIAGLILGISILSGIFLYTTVLTSNVYNTVIEGTPYEIRIDFKEPLTSAEAEAYQQEFLQNVKISDAQYLYGSEVTSFERFDFDRSQKTLEVEIRLEYTEETASTEGRIFSSEYYDSEIGLRLRERLVTGTDPEIYTAGSVYEYGIFIDEDLAASAKLRRGDVIHDITLTIVESSGGGGPGGGGFSSETLSEVNLEDITVAGILIGESASAGVFSEFTETTEVYFPEELFLMGNRSLFIEDLDENNMMYAALKINEDEFNLADPAAVNSQINRLINELEKADSNIIGSNLVASQLMPFQMTSIFIFIFDAVLTIPVAILAFYLLSFGVDLSLHERKYQVGIFKTQGASPSQIKRKILLETLFLAISGLLVGYFIAIFEAWGIGTARGFMKWDWSSALLELPNFFVLDYTAFFVVGGLIMLILIVMVNGKAKSFIQMEVTQTVRRVDETEKENFLRRSNLDVIFFVFGLFTLVLTILIELGISITFGTLDIFIALIGPVVFWIGGAAIVARLAIWLPSKTDPLVKRIFFLKDVAILIKGNVFRKSGDAPRLALIIALTVSFSVLAAVQGTSDGVNGVRTITWGVGADLAVTTGVNFTSTTISSIKAVDSNIGAVMPITSLSGMVLNDQVTIYGVDSSIYGDVGAWLSDSLPIRSSKDAILAELAANPIDGCLMGTVLIREQALSVGETIRMEILDNFWNGTEMVYDYVTRNITIVGTFNHAPGRIGGDEIIIDHQLVHNLNNFTGLQSELEVNSSIEGVSPLFKQYMNGFSGDKNDVLASEFLVSSMESSDSELIKDSLLVTDNDWLISVRTLSGELARADEIQNMDFGIPGLLTADFIISLLAATLSTVIFMSILMEKRKKEFAIIQSYGGSKGQLYKVVFSETIVLLLTAIIWGLLIGLGLSVLFNGFFEFMSLFITPLNLVAGFRLDRILVYNLPDLLFTLGVTFTAMLFATFLSVYVTLKGKISTEVREL
ncbi:MAG: FtsX-like permease family protein [Candidatus Odinarchaeota archaeon]